MCTYGCFSNLRSRRHSTLGLTSHILASDYVFPLLPVLGSTEYNPSSGEHMTKALDPRHTSQWQKLRPILYKRDRLANSPCGICGQPIDYRLTDGPDCWEPDHIKPVRRYPELAFVMSNLQPTHRSCNRSKSDNELKNDNGLGSPSRRWL